MKKEKECKRKTLKEKTGKENQARHYNKSLQKAKLSNETEQILKIITQVHFPEVEKDF